MAPANPSASAGSASSMPNLSPAELSYLHTSLSLPGAPIRPDGRSATQFRPLTAETNILPGTNGSARIGFADGTEAIVGVKAEVEKTVSESTLNQPGLEDDDLLAAAAAGMEEEDETEQGNGRGRGKRGRGPAQSSWVGMSIEIPGYRDDDALPVFLAEMMREALVGSGSESTKEEDVMARGLQGRLVINRRWHWRLYIDVLLLSPPLSYPLPLLSLTTHLALLSTKLPRLKSKGEEDPMFDDDWDASEYLYPRPSTAPGGTSASTPQSQPQFRPPVTLLVISVGENIIFDPSSEEIAVAEAVLAVSLGRTGDSDGALKLLSIRTVDPPGRMTHPGIPNSENTATLAGAVAAGTGASIGAIEGAGAGAGTGTGGEEVAGVWRPRRGGVKRGLIARMVKLVLEKGGVGDEVMEGLEGVEVG